MIRKLKVTDKLISLVSKHPRVSLLGTFAFITALVIGLTIPHGGKDNQETGDTRPPVVEESQVPMQELFNTPKPVEYRGWDVSITPGTKLTLEPGRDDGYVGTVRMSTQAELVLIDGDYSLVLYNVPREEYNYDLSHDHRRLGYVPTSDVKPLGFHLSESAAPDNRYVYFNNSKRIRIEKDEDGAILTTASKGDYARVVGSVLGPEWSDDDWYIVTYGKFIGYIDSKDIVFLSRDQMMDIINNPAKYLKINGTGINLRSKPNKNEKNVVTKLNKGDEARIIGFEDGWYHVIFNGNEGYISSELLLGNTIEEKEESRIPKGLENLHFEKSDNKTI